MGHRAQQHRETISIADARLPVTPENYRRKFLALIHFEEIEHIRLLAEKLVDDHIQIYYSIIYNMRRVLLYLGTSVLIMKYEMFFLHNKHKIQ